MWKWFKGLFRPLTLSPEDLAFALAYNKDMYGEDNATVGLSTIDFSEYVKSYGTETRVFSTTRIDN